MRVWCHVPGIPVLRGIRVQGQSQLCGKFEATLGYTESCLKRNHGVGVGAGEVLAWFRQLAVFAEDQGSVPITHMAAHNHP